MKMNHVPGIPLRVFPGLTRDPYAGVPDYIASNCKIAIFTGTTPTENELWNITNLEDYITLNENKLIMTETCQFKFTYDGSQQKRVIQKWPVGITEFDALNSPTTFNKGTLSPYHLNQFTGEFDAQGKPIEKYSQTLNSLTNLEEIISIEPTGKTNETSTMENGKTVIKKQNLWALVKIPDKDVTLNTTGNDLILFLPNVGTDTKDTVYLSSSTFQQNDKVELRNVTIALFQSYLITDTVISHEYLDPKNLEQVAVNHVTQKSIYINKVWGKRISESYRDAFVSQTTFQGRFAQYNPNLGDLTKNPILSTAVSTINISLLSSFASYAGFFSQDSFGPYVVDGFKLYPRSYDGTVWSETLETIVNKDIIYLFMINQSCLNIIDEINSRALAGTLTTIRQAITNGWLTHKTNSYMLEKFDKYTLDNNLLASILIKAMIQQTPFNENLKNGIKQILISLNISSNTIDRALTGICPIKVDISKYISEYNDSTRILTIKNEEPASLYTRYYKEIKNAFNEQMWLFFPRVLNTKEIYDNNSFPITFRGTGPNYYGGNTFVAPGMNASFVDPNNILNDIPVTVDTKRTSIYDYTAISIGTTGSGSDLEYEQMDIIDAIDAIYAKVRIPNCF